MSKSKKSRNNRTIRRPVGYVWRLKITPIREPRLRKRR